MRLASAPILMTFLFCPFVMHVRGAGEDYRMDTLTPEGTAAGDLTTPPSSPGPLASELSLTSLLHGRTSTPYEELRPRVMAVSSAKTQRKPLKRATGRLLLLAPQPANPKRPEVLLAQAIDHMTSHPKVVKRPSRPGKAITPNPVEQYPAADADRTSTSACGEPTEMRARIPNDQTIGQTLTLGELFDCSAPIA